MRVPAIIALALLLQWPSLCLAQSWGTVEGRITDADSGAPIPGANVVVAGTDFGTAAEADGRYRFRLPGGEYVLRFSAVGFAPFTDSVDVPVNRSVALDVALVPALFELDGIMVEETPRPIDPGAYELLPADVWNIPTPFKGFQALSVLPGVAASNELSNQYSVRGGGFNENLIFINGFEVHMPFRPRQGEQEGLGLFNPALADRVTLYTGGFPVRYGGKLSSALEVRYHRPDEQPVRGSATLSLLDASLSSSASAADGRLGWNMGLRKARARHFFSTQELQGDYRPDYTDLQGLLSYRPAPGHDVEVLGILARHRFDLDPQSRKTYFGMVSADPMGPSDLRSFWVRYGGSEEDGYDTRFAGLRVSNRLSSTLHAEHDVSYFGTVEDERFDIRGTAVIFAVDPNTGNPDTGAGHFPTGSATQEEFAENRVEVSTWTVRGRWQLQFGDHMPEAGWHVRTLHFSDRIDERTAIAGRNTDGDLVRIVVDSLMDTAALSASDAGFYVQNTMDLLPRSGRLVVTAGVRSDYFTFNDEWTFSPRVSTRYTANARLGITGSFGLYHQAPSYRELRGKPEPGRSILGSLNRSIRSQRSLQLAAGAELFFPSRRLYVRAELYHKNLSDLISYELENVRVRYSGRNDSQGKAYGVDLRIRGELVPGLESWLNYGFLRAVEAFHPTYATERTQGDVPRPSDQRHTVSLFVQDYVPGDPTWKLHLRALFGSGLPYTPPVPGPSVGSFVSQLPGDRHSARYPEYKRIDMGVTKIVDFGSGGGSLPLRIELTGELLNVFDMTNTVSYTWVPDGSGIWQRIPTRLTPRTFNVRARIEF